MFDVKSILDRQVRDGVMKVLIRWAGYGRDADEWVCEVASGAVNTLAYKQFQQRNRDKFL